MSYNDIVQAIADAQTDAQTLEDVVNGEPNKQAKSRLGSLIYTLATINHRVDIATNQANQKLTELQDAINTAAAAGAGENGWATDLVVEDGLTQKQINAAQKIKNSEVVSILNFCKCNGTDESAKALQAVEAANAKKLPLYIPHGYELHIRRTIILNPKYGLFGGGRIRLPMGFWDTTYPPVLIDTPYQFVDNITFVKSNTPYVDINTVTLTDASTLVGWIEVTNDVTNFKITNCTFRGGRFGVWLYGGQKGLIANNDAKYLEEAFLYFGVTDVYKQPTRNVGWVDGLLVLGNRVSHVSNEAIGGSTGDGIKMTTRVKNVIFANNDICFCRGDAIDMAASGQNVVITGNNLAQNVTKGIDIKSNSDEFPAAEFGLGQQVVISNNNIFENQQYGVTVNVAILGVVYPNMRLVNVCNNNIYGNGYGGVYYRGQNGLISGNMVYNNALAVGAISYAAGIYIEGVDNTIVARNIDVINNTAINNGNATDTNNCGIYIKSATDCNVHGNQAHNVSTSTVINTNSQNYGIYCAGGTKNISFLHNKCEGNTLQDVGWYAAECGLVGTLRTVTATNISTTTNTPIMLGDVKRNHAIVGCRYQGAIDANATNYYTLELREQTGATTSVQVYLGSLKTDTNAITLYGYLLPLRRDNTYPSGSVPYLFIKPTGTPVAVDRLTITANIIEW